MQLTPMLGENLKNYPISVLDGKLWRMSEKIDGVRRLFYKSATNDVSAWSRTNHEDVWLPHIHDYLANPKFPSDTVYDCELVDRELYFKHVPSFVLRSASNAKASQQYPDNKADLMAICFDIFKPGGDLRKGSERDVELYSIFHEGTNNDPMIRVPIFGTVFGADTDIIYNTMNQVTERNGEGLMLLDMDSIYIPGRSAALLKVKRTQEFIGMVIDLEMGRPGTKIEGMVAALICRVPGCTMPVRVGSGFNNAERTAMVYESPIGKEIEIDAFSYSQDKRGAVSLNLPIFKQFVRR
jgi:ATP-dependent DNA ligase